MPLTPLVIAGVRTFPEVVRELLGAIAQLNACTKVTAHLSSHPCNFALTSLSATLSSHLLPHIVFLPPTSSPHLLCTSFLNSDAFC